MDEKRRGVRARNDEQNGFNGERVCHLRDHKMSFIKIEWRRIHSLFGVWDDEFVSEA